MSSASKVTSADSLWLHMEHPTNLMFVTSLLFFDETLNVDRIKTLLEERLARFKRFRQCAQKSILPAAGLRWTEKADFNIDCHVTHMALPQPGNKETLKTFINKLISTPLDHTKPLWDVHIIEGYRGSGSIVCVRIHHAIADGIALIHVLLSTMDREMADEFSETSAYPRSEEHGSRLESIVAPVTSAIDRVKKVSQQVIDYGTDLITQPTKAVEVAKVAGHTMTTLGRLLSYGPDTKTILTGKLGVLKRVDWSDPIRVEEVKEIGQHLNGTVNDVLLTLFAGAMRQYLAGCGEPVDDIEIRIMVPVALRPLEKSENLGNHFGTVTLALPINKEDPLERLRILKERMDALKTSPEAYITLSSMALVGATPKNVASKVAEIFNKSCSAVVTNVPGPREPLYFTGKEIKKIMVWAPVGGKIPFGSSIFSYNGEVTLGVFTDKEIVPDPEAISTAFVQEFKVLKQMVEFRETLPN